MCINIIYIACGNQLCDTEIWSIMAGEWIWQTNDSCCVVDKLDTGSGSNTWIATSDGLVSNYNYNFESFTFVTKFSVSSEDIYDGGVLFRAINVSSKTDYGFSYYYGIKEKDNSIVLGQFSNQFVHC